MLKAEGLTCARGERTLFTNLTFSVSVGEWLHVKGENGIGKTSLLRLLTGLAHPVTGQILWNDQSIQEDPAVFRQDMLFLGHHGAVKEDLSALENLQFAAAIDGIKLADATALQSLKRFGLLGREDLPVRVLSAGQKRRVLLARLATRQAKLWILDEPFTALDVKAVELLNAALAEHLAGAGMAIVTNHQTINIPGGRILQL